MNELEPRLCPKGPEKCPVFADLEQLVAELTLLRQQVIRDPLTGLFNRGHFDALLATELERSRRSHLPTSLLLLDIDHFKAINDRFGHVAGDRVLKGLARAVEKVVRVIDAPCRYGGEEFAVILPATPLLIASQVAERLRAILAATEVAVDSTSVYFTVSVGVSSYNYDQRATATQLVERADRQLYKAKAQGRNRVACERHKRPPSQLSSDEQAALFGRSDVEP